MIGRALKTIREMRGLSLSEASRQLELSKAYVSEIENNKKTPTLDLISRFSRLYGIPTSHIIFFAENYDANEGSQSKIFREKIGMKILDAMRLI